MPTELYCDYPSDDRIEVVILGLTLIKPGGKIEPTRETLSALVTRTTRPTPEEITSFDVEHIDKGIKYTLHIDWKPCPVRFTPGMGSTCPICRGDRNHAEDNDPEEGQGDQEHRPL